ncbi:GntR family transcriptional regulator [Allostreptomyces psammosilenae]|uniref:DNA-binding GntR family transcriptional regulator n=1 Tax=Allostreptomyces psammosilenae TaxID=1892865 RepID=A0A853A0P6_9ACTN|nr:GntR family transcriptional regulator [Allostreptomyces psammosilenae]NYI04391.1 DNA-binding GntR family transcriptional regulator [Allostreptomyces psammosilenae]
MGTQQVHPIQEPKYWRLRTVLGRALDSEFAVGEVLPNERDLAARFGVARATLRQALDQLELEGRLHRRRGIGTLVAGSRVGVPVGGGEGQEPAPHDTWHVVDHADTTPPVKVLRALALTDKAPVHRVLRARRTRGQVVGTEYLYVPADLLPDLDATPAGAQRARAVLHAFWELDAEEASRSVELGVAEPDVAQVMENPPGTPVLVVTTWYRLRGRVAALSVGTYRADTCRLTFGEAEPVPLAS